MSSDDRDSIMAAYEELDAAFDKVLALSLDSLTCPEKLALENRMERNLRRAPIVEHRLLNSLSQVQPEVLGGTSLAEVLATRLRISKEEARWRIEQATVLGPRQALSGEQLTPLWPTVAEAQRHGQIGAEHLRVITRFFDKLPDAIDYQSREAAEEDLAGLAVGFGPAELRQCANRLAYLLDQDGSLSDAERARRRCLSIGKQGVDGMSRLTGWLDPEGRATLDAALAKWAAPGMYNPDDEKPCVDGEPGEETIRKDLRSQSQRNHDALKAMGRSALASGQLGQHNGLPATIVVSTTLHELESGAGQAVTAGGSLLPMSDVIRLASHAHHYLVIYDEHRRIPLYLGRSKRIASPGQRIVLHERDRGCTFPGCTVPGYGCQAHHGKKSWAKGGQTNIDEEVLACGPHNRLIEKGGWTTRIRRDGRTEWIPPPNLDTGQARVNNYHHPERYLTDP